MEHIPADFDAAVQELASNANISIDDAKAFVASIQNRAKNGELTSSFIQRLMGSEVASAEKGGSTVGNNACGGGSNAC